MENTQFPKLDPPGAGLPWMEAFLLKNFYYPLRHKKFSWTENIERFRKETQKTLKICENLDEESFQTRILISRLRGMEDSSRFWSVALTIEHLCITMKGMSMIASELAQDRMPSLEVKTASVKPKQENITTKPGMIEKFTKISEETIGRLEPWSQNHSKKHRLIHPWFGPIDSEGWVWTIGQHQALHRRQIEFIVERL